MKKDYIEQQKPHTILVVDDSEFFRTELIEFLDTQPGWKVVGEVGNGAGAIALAGILMPDLILMDIHMPGMDGIEASHHIKNQDTSVRIVLLTIHDEDIYHWLAENFHIDGFVSKASVKQDLPRVLLRIHNTLHPS